MFFFERTDRGFEMLVCMCISAKLIYVYLFVPSASLFEHCDGPFPFFQHSYRVFSVRNLTRTYFVRTCYNRAASLKPWAKFSLWRPRDVFLVLLWTVNSSTLYMNLSKRLLRSWQMLLMLFLQVLKSVHSGREISLKCIWIWITRSFPSRFSSRICPIHRAPSVSLPAQSSKRFSPKLLKIGVTTQITTMMIFCKF